MKLSAELVADIDARGILAVLNGEDVPAAWDKEPEDYIRDLTQELQNDIDSWLNSGRKEDGSESPERRSSARAWQGAKSHIEHWTGLEFQTGPGGQPQVRLIPKYSPLTGVIEVKERWGEIIAIILLSDLGKRIAKCRHRKCSRYFLLKPQRKKVYANGLFCCLEHNRAESALKSLSDRRKKADGQLEQAAARELVRLSRGEVTVPHDVKRELVKKLNLRIAKDPRRTRNQISVNWVTHHWKTIQEKVEELSHAKAKEKN